MNIEEDRRSRVFGMTKKRKDYKRIIKEEGEEEKI